MQIRPVWMGMHGRFVPVPMCVLRGHRFGVLVQMMAIVVCVRVDVLHGGVIVRMLVPSGHKNDHGNQKQHRRQRLRRRQPLAQAHQ